MAAIDMDNTPQDKRIVPRHFFTTEHATYRDRQGAQRLAYKRIPMLDADGQPMIEEQVFTDGKVIKRPMLVEDLAAPIMVDHFHFQPHGSKDEVIAKVGGPGCFIANLEHQAFELAEPIYPGWMAKAFRASYTAFKNGQTLVDNHHDILSADFLTMPVRQHLQKIGISSIEMCANSNESMLQQLGTGGRAVVNACKEALERLKTDGAKATHAKVDALETLVKQQSEQLAKLMAMLQPGATKADAPTVEAKPEVKAPVVERKADPEAATEEPALTVASPKPKKRANVGAAVDAFLAAQATQQ